MATLKGLIINSEDKFATIAIGVNGYHIQFHYERATKFDAELLRDRLRAMAKEAEDEIERLRIQLAHEERIRDSYWRRIRAYQGAMKRRRNKRLNQEIEIASLRRQLAARAS